MRPVAVRRRTMLQGGLLALLGLFYAATAWVALHPTVSVHYRDHFIRQVTADWRVLRSEASLADGTSLAMPYPREVLYTLGLSGAEPDGRWSDARLWPAAVILLQHPIEGVQCLELRLAAASAQVGAPVAIRLGDAAAEVTLPDGAVHDVQLTLRPAAPADRIEIEPSRPARPRHELRRLAVKLSWLRLRPGACAG
ncbi:MAG: hypothetical protein U1E53_11370 [Dongiaceae bacterium]